MSPPPTAEEHWFLRALRPRPAPVPWAAAARAALAIAGPLAVGVAVGKVPYGVLVSLGALNGVMEDRHTAYRTRLIRMIPPQLAGAVGIVVGHAAAGRGWTTVLTLVAVALVSGVISPVGGIASSCGLMLLLLAGVGTGVPLPDPWWLPPLLMLCGAALVIVLALLAWPLRRGIEERAAVAEVYYAAAARLRVGTGGGGVQAARGIGAALDAAYDVLVRHRATSPGRDPAVRRLMIQLNAVNPILEAISAIGRDATPVDPALPDAVTRLGDAIASGHDVVDEPGFVPHTPAEQALRAALRYAAGRLAPPPADATGVFARDPDALGVAQGSWGPRAGLTHIGTVLAGPAPWLYALRLALCIGIGAAIVQVTDLPRSYWVVLTITFVLKPDFGSVFVRGLLRALGTLVGVLVAAVLLTYVPRGWGDVAVVAALGFLVPIVMVRSYAMMTAAMTPLLLLFTDQLGHAGVSGLVPARLLDTVLGCAIVLVFGYLLWPEGRHTRLRQLVANAVDADAAYIRLLNAEGSGGKAARSRARRRSYNTLTTARTAFQQALAEPPPVSRRAAAFWPVLVSIEHLTDAIVAASVYVDSSIDHAPAARIVTACADRMDALGAAIRRGEPAPAPDGGTPSDTEAPVLNGVLLEVSTAFALHRDALEAERAR